MNEIIIRKATYLDISEILLLFNKYLEDAKVREYPPSCDYTGVWIADLIHRHVFLVAEIDKKIVGMLGFRFTSFPWNDKALCLASDIYMVDSEYRKSKASRSLLEESKRLGETLNMMIVFGIMTGVDAELKDRFTRMGGFKYLGGNFIYGSN
jgi:hypothetical protein